jgi:phosphoglycolate phosphatase-like HAD superfamily hydrolase
MKAFALALTLASVAVACNQSTPVVQAPASQSTAAVDPLPSWNESTARKAIVDFVGRTTKEGAPDFVPPAERIAVFDNDGTLWAEQPMYFQLAFALDRIKALAAKHPEWKTTQPFTGAIEGDLKAVLATGAAGLMQIIAASHTGITTEEFEAIVIDWIGSARHPGTGRRYDEMVYQPMLDMLTYLRANGYKTFIVSGGGVEFMRPWVERVYGIPPEQVVGSRVKVKYEPRDGAPVLLRLAEIDLNDDKAGKPVGIHQVIGRRPTIAFGNSDGDFEMLEWTTSAKGPRLGVIVHHTDAEREWAYDRDSHIGQLVRGLDEGPQRGWVIVDMKNDWNVIYPMH